MPSLYFAEGVPYVLVNIVSVVMYKKLGVSNTNIAFWTSLLSLPWVLKPLWGPLVDMYWTKRLWFLAMQFLMAFGSLGVAAFMQLPFWWAASLTALGVIALFSATHDIAADGFYMLGLDQKDQSFFVGIRSTFYRIAMVTGQGVLVIVAGMIEVGTDPNPAQFTVHAVPKGAMVEQVAAQPLKGERLIVEPATISIAADTTAPVRISLASAPETTVVITNSRMAANVFLGFFNAGPETVVSLVSGERMEFSPENWSKPQDVVLRVDAKLAKPVDVHVKAAVPKLFRTWTMCFGAMGLIYLLLALYHTAIVPKPAIDRSVVQGQTPPFVQAAGTLFITMAFPVVVFVTLFYGFPGLVSSVVSLTGSQLTTASAVVFAVVIAAMAGLFGMGLSTGAKERKSGGSIIDLVPVLVLLGLMFVGLNPMLDSAAKGIGWKVRPELLTFVTNALIVAIMFFFFQPSGICHSAGTAFHGAAKLSGIPFDEVFVSFFKKPGIVRMIIFLLVYRIGEAMLVKMSAPFLLDTREKGGMGLTAAQYGIAYGTVGVFTMMAGGILGGLIAARTGLKKCIFWFCLILNLPHAFYLVLAYLQPENFLLTVFCVAGETFGYGLGFTAYMIYMLYIAGEGEHKTSHFALSTGFMALSMMLPGMISGAIQDSMANAFGHYGYVFFFVFVLLLAIPSLAVVFIIPLDAEFGKKHKSS